jgi:hypothetical protein
MLQIIKISAFSILFVGFIVASNIREKKQAKKAKIEQLKNLNHENNN